MRLNKYCQCKTRTHQIDAVKGCRKLMLGSEMCYLTQVHWRQRRETCNQNRYWERLCAFTHCSGSTNRSAVLQREPTGSFENGSLGNTPAKFWPLTLLYINTKPSNTWVSVTVPLSPHYQQRLRKVNYSCRRPRPRHEAAHLDLVPGDGTMAVHRAT